MIVGCQGVISPNEFLELEIVLKRPFEPRVISIAEPGWINIVSFRLGADELVHDRNPIDGRSFVELFPQLRTRRLQTTERIVMLVQNRSFQAIVFSCSLAGIE